MVQLLGILEDFCGIDIPEMLRTEVLPHDHRRAAIDGRTQREPLSGRMVEWHACVQAVVLANIGKY